MSVFGLEESSPPSLIASVKVTISSTDELTAITESTITENCSSAQWQFSETYGNGWKPKNCYVKPVLGVCVWSRGGNHWVHHGRLVPARVTRPTGAGGTQLRLNFHNCAGRWIMLLNLYLWWSVGQMLTRTWLYHLRSKMTETNAALSLLIYSVFICTRSPLSLSHTHTHTHLE